VKTPKEFFAKFNAEMQKALADPQINDKLSQMGVIINSGTPGRFAEFLKLEFEKWAKVIKAAGVQAG